jgi:hypothetical protein
MQLSAVSLCAADIGSFDPPHLAVSADLHLAAAALLVKAEVHTLVYVVEESACETVLNRRTDKDLNSGCVCSGGRPMVNDTGVTTADDSRRDDRRYTQ